MSLIQPRDGAAHDTHATLSISFDGLCVKLTIDLPLTQHHCTVGLLEFKSEGLGKGNLKKKRSITCLLCGMGC